MSAVNFTPEEKSVIVGSLLGDGYVGKHNSLQIEHSLSQAEYVHWKYRKLKSIAGKPPRVITRFDVRTQKSYQSIRFYTRCVMNDFRRLFYNNGIKIVPSNLSEYLDDLALAVWFMDDGGRGANTLHGIVFNTSAYSEDEQFHLKNILYEKFNLKLNVHRIGRGYQLYVASKSYSSFYNRISSYLISEMKYKLVNPVTTEFRNSGMR